MKFASITDRIKTDDDAECDPWEVHAIASKRQAAGEDIIMLSIGQEADEVTPKVIVASAIDSLSNGDHHYTDVNGTPELRNCIAQYHTKLTGQSVSAENCTAFAGAQNALFATAQILLETGDEVIVSEPYYTTYAATFSASGANVISVPVTKDNEYQLRPDDIANAVSNNTQAIVLNSPNNPMGTCYSKQDFESIVNLCVEHKIWLIMDAVYLDIVTIDSNDLPHGIADAADILITIGSLSKSHRMTGWRMGWAIAPIKVSEHFADLSMCMHYGLPPFIMRAAITAITDSSQTPELVRNTLMRRRHLAAPILQQIKGASFYDSGQGMFMLIDVSALGISAFQFSMHLLDQYKVAVLPCDGFGATGNKLVRIGLCVDDEKLVRACHRILECTETFYARLP